jgi:hypothetical protein
MTSILLERIVSIERWWQVVVHCPSKEYLIINQTEGPRELNIAAVWSTLVKGIKHAEDEPSIAL